MPVLLSNKKPRPNSRRPPASHCTHPPRPPKTSTPPSRPTDANVSPAWHFPPSQSFLLLRLLVPRRGGTGRSPPGRFFAPAPGTRGRRGRRLCAKGRRARHPPASSARRRPQIRIMSCVPRWRLLAAAAQPRPPVGAPRAVVGAWSSAPHHASPVTATAHVRPAAPLLMSSLRRTDACPCVAPCSARLQRAGVDRRRGLPMMSRRPARRLFVALSEQAAG